MKNKYRVGYIDEESQWVDIFVKKMKSTFNVVTFKLTSDTTLNNILEEIIIAELDCLVVDFELKEADVIQFNGDEIVDCLRTKYPYFPVLIITSKDEDYVLDQVEDNDIVRLKDELTEKSQILIQRIFNKIKNYKDRIDRSENIIREIIEKKNREGISIPEEELLTEQYLFLEKINPEEKTIPDNLIQPESITKLNEFVSDTKQILEELRKLKS